MRLDLFLKHTKSKNSDILCVGNALIDAFLTIHNADKYCHYQQQNREICFVHGQKIMLDSADFVLGGNACNVAVGLSRLSLKSSLIAETGNDEFAQKIVHGLKKEGIDLSFFQQTPQAAASFAIGINFMGERTLFVEHVKRKHDFKFQKASSDWVFLTSLGEEWKETYAHVLTFIKENNCKLAFNPGSHQLEEGVDSFSDIIKSSYILHVNKEEAEKISNKENQTEIKELLISLQKLGPKIVVLTDGKNGSFAIDQQGKMFHLGIIEAEIVERTGAGDAYTSGFLAACMRGLSIGEAMKWGSINAASVIGKIGAQAGLLTKNEIIKKLEEQKEFQAVELS